MPASFPLPRRDLLRAGALLAAGSAGRAAAGDLPCPAARWERVSPREAGLDPAVIRRFDTAFGGAGCLVRDARIVHSWGDLAAKKDWASAAKPVLSTLLMLAVRDGLLDSPDALVAAAGWPLLSRHRAMTFRHLANMVSGYARGEAPGAAWAYNDVAIQLYARSLERIFGGPLQEAFAGRLGMLQLEDGDFFGSRGGMGVLASVRDFARLGWLWLCRGRWGKQVVLPGALFAACARPGVPPNCPRSAAAGEDYLKVGSYGGGTDQTPHGPGVYGFNWWFNEPVRPGGPRAWPGLPPDAYQANGMWNRDTVTVLPGLRMVAVIRGASPGPFAPGEESAPANRAFALLAAAAG